MKISKIKSEKIRSIADAEKERKFLNDKRTALQETIEDLEKQISNVETKNSDAVLNGESVNYKELNDLTNQLNVNKKAMAEIDNLMPVAERNLTLARAKSKRDEAQKLRKQAKDIRDKTAPLFDKLFEIEGCKFVPFSHTSSQSVNTAISTERLKDMVTPKSEQLERQAEIYEKDALKLEASA